MPGKLLVANGTENWSLKLRKALKPGKYVISVRPVGSTNGAFVNKRLTLTK